MINSNFLSENIKITQGNNNIKKRSIYNVIFKFFVIIFSVASILPLFFILFYIVKNGIRAINWQFLINLPQPVGETGGGISNAIVGTFILIILSSILSIPLGILSGIYLSENKKSKLSYLIRLSVEVLHSIPSIVMGIIAYIWIVKPMGVFSSFSGAFALGLMMLPVIIKSTEETMNLVPHSLKEASLSLGVPHYKTILKVILPSSVSGILTGILLGIARISGETAPLLFTSFGNPFMNSNIFKPMNSLSLLIFNYATSPYKDWQSIAWGASLILIIFVLLINLIANGVSRRWKVQF